MTLYFRLLYQILNYDFLINASGKYFNESEVGKRIFFQYLAMSRLKHTLNWLTTRELITPSKHLYYFLFLMLISKVSLAFEIERGKIQMLVYEDSSGSLSFDDVRMNEFHNHFTELPKSEIRYNASKLTIWIKFKLTDPLPGHSIYYIELSSPHLHYLDYYSANETGEYETCSTGFFRNFDTRPIPIDRFALPLTVGNQWHFIRIQSEHFLNTKLRLTTTGELTKKTSERMVINGLYTGLTLIIIVAVIFYVITSKHYQYLFYAGFLLFFKAAILVERGFYFQFLWPQHPIINYFFPLIPYCTVICLLLFLKTQLLLQVETISQV